MSKKKFKDADYPVYEIVIDDDDSSGIRFVSIVGEPAIEQMGMYFNKNQTPVQYEFKADNDKQIIIGPAMLAGKKILRKDDDGNKYYVVFTKETIAQMVQKFNANGSNRRINVDHTNKMVDAYIMENWIVEDSYYDKSRMYGFDVPVGSWMISVKIEDQDFWKQEVKDMGKYGFSIEGMMSQKIMEYNSIEECFDALTDEEVLQLVKEVQLEADGDTIFQFLSQKGKSKSGIKFQDEDDELAPLQKVYTYGLKSGETELIQDNTRDFCKHMVMLDKYWTDDDVTELNSVLSYDFWKYFGSYNCRHEMKTVYTRVVDKDRPSSKDIDDAGDLSIG